MTALLPAIISHKAIRSWRREERSAIVVGSAVDLIENLAFTGCVYRHKL